MRASIVALLLFVAPALAALPLQVERTEVRSLVSKTNGINYKLYIAYPHGYDDAKKRFPVVYLLDADYSFLIARNIADHLAERNHLRELILVGIAYDGPPQYRMHRTRDYTPKFFPSGGYGPEMQKVSGGGPKFRTFLEKELIPHIDATLRTMPGERCLVGHSYGGLFGTWNLLSSPPLFNRYIIVSPSLWYAERFLFDHARKRPAAGARVYMASGASEDPVMASDLREMARLLEKDRRLALEWDVLAAETHNSIFPRALSNGLRHVFEGR